MTSISLRIRDKMHTIPYKTLCDLGSSYLCPNLLCIHCIPVTGTAFLFLECVDGMHLCLVQWLFSLPRMPISQISVRVTLSPPSRFCLKVITSTRPDYLIWNCDPSTPSIPNTPYSVLILILSTALITFSHSQWFTNWWSMVCLHLLECKL